MSENYILSHFSRNLKVSQTCKMENVSFEILLKRNQILMKKMIENYINTYNNKC